MIATVVNAVAVVLGTVVGLIVGSRIGEIFRKVLFTAIGVVSLLIGISMALETQRFLYLALALVLGGLIGTALGIEDAIYRLGERLKRRFARKEPETQEASGHNFALGFLNASVLYCVGALTIIGAFQAGVEKEYELLFTKSVMDGFMSILLSAAYGIGVGFSALSILIYQGGLTLAGGLLQPIIGDLLLSEISGVGGAMVVMIGLNLLDLRKIKTADFLPALVVVVVFVLLDPWLGGLAL